MQLQLRDLPMLKRIQFAVPMRSRIAIALLLCATPISLQAQTHIKNNDQPAPTYNPYPPGILPSNLDSEVARVLRETHVIEGHALARWHALPPPIPAGQPPVLQDTGT